MLVVPLAGSGGASADLSPADGRTMADAGDIRMETARRQEDIDRIDQKLAQMRSELAQFRVTLTQTGAQAAAKQDKLRKLIIIQDQMNKGDLIHLITSSGSFQEALISVRTYGKIMERSASEYSAAAQKRSTLQGEIQRLDKEIEDQKEIKNLLEKRKKELNNQLNTASETKLYI